MTKDEFEKRYAERNGVTVEWLYGHNQIAVPCACGEDGCKGWQMRFTGSLDGCLGFDSYFLTDLFSVATLRNLANKFKITLTNLGYIHRYAYELFWKGENHLGLSRKSFARYMSVKSPERIRQCINQLFIDGFWGEIDLC